ncbi:hypothetical protein CTAYLR_002592 [Chrysophaeum taylorii]|uniref:PCI domain-containing protein n=1 Tax=Chrysophaeum taylorii TaxID=2483200 RepID=A0AAD7UEX5_9STRA|nr:hypothetical protein CTAYLR_002592 [Chrysophaeum taylorii]
MELVRSGKGSYASLGELYDKKLWHELTLKMETVVRTEDDAVALLALADDFLPKFEAKINQLAYAQILSAILSSCVEKKALAAETAIERLDQTVDQKKGRLGREASLFLSMEAACLRLDIGQPVKDQLDAAKPIIDSLTNSNTAVFYKYYSACAEYYKKFGPPEEFYRAALSYLSYASEDQIKDPVTLATDMSLAALAGDLYNFGEILTTPILAALERTDLEWLGDLLKACGRGDVDHFRTILMDHDLPPVLVARLDFVKEKIALLALMNLLFETPSRSRALDFDAISRRTRLDIDKVEWLVMRAMALNLVRGQIDEVKQSVHFSWVAPRVLDDHQIAHLVTQLDTLNDKAKTAFDILSDQTVDLI